MRKACVVRHTLFMQCWQQAATMANVSALLTLHRLLLLSCKGVPVSDNSQSTGILGSHPSPYRSWQAVMDTMLRGSGPAWGDCGPSLQ